MLQLVQEILKHWPGAWQDQSDPDAPHEAERLALATDKVFHLLGLHPQWNFAETVHNTVGWYLQSLKKAKDYDFIRDLTQEQITSYTKNLPY